jgi:hypothetical protein
MKVVNKFFSSRVFTSINNRIGLLLLKSRKKKVHKKIIKILQGEKVDLIPVLDSGFCNRLRALLALMASQEVKYYIWPDSGYDNNRMQYKNGLHDFFENVDLKLVKKGPSNKLYESWFMPFPLTNIPNDVFILDSVNFGGMNGRFDPSQDHWYLDKIKEIFWDQLVPKQEFLEKLDAVLPKKYAVIHVRDWEYNDSLDSIIKINDFDRTKFLTSPKISLQSLTEKIDEVDDTFEVFVVSYKNETVELVKGCSDRVKSFPILDDRSFAQDFLEFLFLSKADIIIGSRYSTFSHTAAILSRSCKEYSLFD